MLRGHSVARSESELESAMNERNPKVDSVLRKATQWQEEFEQLRTIALDCGLTEELKWISPVTCLRTTTLF